jgi:hypothetical protein
LASCLPFSEGEGTGRLKPTKPHPNPSPREKELEDSSEVNLCKNIFYINNRDFAWRSNWKIEAENF